MNRSTDSIKSRMMEPHVSGANNVKGSLPTAKTVGTTLHKQVTGLPKEISRKLRVDRSIEYDGDPLQNEGKLHVDVVMANPVPKPNTAVRAAGISNLD